MGRAMNLEIQRERIGLLRASAAALIDETISEPCWGLAQSLAEMAEALVRESGLPAACFGKGAHLSAELATSVAEALPECCAACGEWAGQHVNWCIHADHGEPASSSPVASSEPPLHYFGCCPICHLPGQLTFIGTDNWFVCHEHMIAWCAGSGLFSGWQELTPEQHEANRALIEQCERIESPLCTCSSPASERSPFESDAPRWLAEQAEDAAAGELLDWLDVSGLPAVPPEQPARRRQNWRFDDPDNVDRIPF